jgi:hypothetical protein
MTDKKSLETELHEVQEKIDHNEQYAIDAKKFIYGANLVGNQYEIEHWSDILEETEEVLNTLRESEAVLQYRIRRLHLEWVSKIEESGAKLHEQGYNHGWPLSPRSLLMYRDGDNFIFQRDEQDRYSSYRFWVDTMDYTQPILCLGQDYYSSEQLGVKPATLDRLYELEQLRIKGNMAAEIQEEILEIRATMRPLGQAQ